MNSILPSSFGLSKIIPLVILLILTTHSLAVGIRLTKVNAGILRNGKIIGTAEPGLGV
jgi:hypothetical protein